MRGKPLIRWSIQPAQTSADWDAVHALFVEYFESLDADLCKPDLEREIGELPGVFGETGGDALVAWSGETGTNLVPVGCCAIRPGPDNETAELYLLYVRPAGRRGGLGWALTQAACDRAAELGYGRIVLHTLARWEAATALYRTCGFVPAEPYGGIKEEGVLYFSCSLGNG